MWVPYEPPTPEAMAPPPEANGPLQAFGQVHRALRDVERRMSALGNDLRALDSRLDQTKTSLDGETRNKFSQAQARATQARHPTAARPYSPACVTAGARLRRGGARPSDLRRAQR